MNPLADTLDQRLVWRIRWRDMLGFLFPGEYALHTVDWQPWGVTFNRREQRALLYTARPTDFPGMFEQLNPCELFIGQMLNLAREHWKMPRPPADYIVDQVRVCQSHPQWMYPAVIGTGRDDCGVQLYKHVGDVIEFHWRRGPGQVNEQELPPHPRILHELADKLDVKMSLVWPWFFKGFTEIDRAFVQMRHVHRHDQPIQYKPAAGVVNTLCTSLMSDGHWWHFPSRRHGCRGVRLFITSCQVCRENYWMIALEK